MADVVSPLGEVGHVPDEQLQQALASGYSLATPEQVQQAQLKAEYGGALHQVGAAASGLARGATIGLSDVAIAKLGGAETLKAYDELHPELRMGGELVGAVAPAFIGDEAGLGSVGKALRGLTSPARGVMALGEGAEAAMAARGLGRAFQLGAAGAAEGAAYGFGDTLARGAVDNDLSGEKLAVSMLTNALLGGAAGYGLGAIGSRIGRALNRPGEAALQRVGDAAFDGGAKGLGRSLAEGMADLSAMVSGTDREAARALLGSAEARRIATTADEALPEFVDAAAKHIDAIEMNWDTISQKWRQSALKRDEIARVIGKGGEGEAAGAFLSQVTDMRSKVDLMLADGDKYAGQRGLKDFRRVLDDFEGKVQTAAQQGGADVKTEMYSALDQMKRELGKHTDSAAAGVRTKGTYRYKNTFETLDGMYHGLRDSLENEAVWGGAATLQREINRPLTGMMGVRNAYSQNFLSQYGRSKANPWMPAYVADRDKIARYVGNLLNPNKDLAHRALQETLQYKQDAAAAMLRGMDLQGAERAAVEGIHSEAKALSGKLEAATETILRRNQLRALEPGENAVLGGLLAGSVVSGHPLIGLAMAPLVNPARTVRQLAAIERMAGSVDVKLGGKIRALFREAAPTGFGRAAAQIPVRGEAFADRRDEFRAKSARVREVANRSDGLRAELGNRLRLIETGAPRAHETAIATALRAAEYLRREMPGTAIPMSPFAPPPTVSKADASSWLRKLRAVEDPTTLIDDLEGGKLSRETVNAVGEVYPSLLADMQRQVTDQMHALDVEGKRPPYQRRLQLGIMLGMQTDPTLQPSLIAAMRDIYAAQPEAQKQGSAAPAQPIPDFASAFRAGSEQHEGAI